MVPIRVGRGTVENKGDYLPDDAIVLRMIKLTPFWGVVTRLLLVYWEKKSSQRLKGVDVEGREDAFVDGDKVE